MPKFSQYIGIDYSGAQTPTARLGGLRVYVATNDASPLEVRPPHSPHKNWSRRDIAEWLIERLTNDGPTLVGIDHGFSFPRRYFEAYGLSLDWPTFLDDFQRHWPTDDDNTYVDFVRDGTVGNGGARRGNSRWRRLTEEHAGSAKSVFHFDVPGSVAKSTHSGIPWLRFIRQRLGPLVHFWPFEGWKIPEGRSAIVEVYPALWSNNFALEDRSLDQHDAFSVAAWLSYADLNGYLSEKLMPSLTSKERDTAQVEGWILGVSGSIRDAEKMVMPERVVPEVKHRKERVPRKTTLPGYVNKNGQTVVKRTSEPGNDHNQVVYVLRCLNCKREYGANGADIWQRHCPFCSHGAPGLAH